MAANSAVAASAASAAAAADAAAAETAPECRSANAGAGGQQVPASAAQLENQCRAHSRQGAHEDSGVPAQTVAERARHTAGEAPEAALTRLRTPRAPTLLRLHDPAVKATWLERTAALLEHQWPRGGHREQLRRSCDAWPIHFIAVLPHDNADDLTLVAHASLQLTVDGGDGRSALLQSLVVAPEQRGTGLGRWMLECMEAAAAARGAGYLILSTPDKAAFYVHCGYSPCDPANAESPAMRKLDDSAIQSLESILTRGPRPSCARAAVGQADGTGGSFPVPFERVQWLRKRLHAFSTHVIDAEPDVLREQLVRYFQHDITLPTSGSDSSITETITITGESVLIPWRKQIGPSCGLAALSCVVEHFARRLAGRASASKKHSLACSRKSVCEVLAMDVAAHQLEAVTAIGGAAATPADDAAGTLRLRLQGLASEPSTLLLESQNAGLSTDGEMFSAASMAATVRSICGLRASLLTVAAGNFAAIVDVLAAGGLVLLPYDTNGRIGHRPCCVGGRSAHWGVIVGTLHVHVGSSGSNVGAPAPPSGDLIVLQHTMSARPVIDSWAAFTVSNLQLQAPDPRRASVMRWVVAAPSVDAANGKRFTSGEAPVSLGCDLAGRAVAVWCEPHAPTLADADSTH